MTLKTILPVVLVLMLLGADVEGHNTIQTDRPDQTESSYLVPVGMLQYEGGLNYERPGDGSTLLVTPTLLWRLAINERFELRMITDISSSETGNGHSFGLDPVAVGLKTALLEEDGWIPKTSLIAHLNLPWLATSDRVVDNHYTDFRFTFLNTLSEKVSLGYNMGAEWKPANPSTTFIYTFAPSFSLSDRLGCYVEAFGFLPENGKGDHRVDAGFTFLVTDNAQLDLSGGKTITKTESDAYYVSLGYSWRWRIKKAG